MSGDPNDDHAHEPWPEVSYGAMARAAAMVAGYLDWVNVTRWPIDYQAQAASDHHERMGHNDPIEVRAQRIRDAAPRAGVIRLPEPTPEQAERISAQPPKPWPLPDEPGVW